MNSQRSVFRAGDIGEMINALPAMFGFPPDDSLVVLGLDSKRIVFGMRLDLADVGRGKAGIATAADLAVSHLEHQGVGGAIVLAVGEPLALGRRLVLAVESRLVRVQPVAGGWATDDRYWVSMVGGDPNGYPYRRSLDHPAAVQAIVEGQEIASSRAAVASAYAPVCGDRRRDLDIAARSQLPSLTSTFAALSGEQLDEFAVAGVRPVVDDLLLGRSVDDDSFARVGFLLRHIPTRDHAWQAITPESARALVGVWLHIARHVPVAWAPPAYCLSAFASWLCGDGARASMALEQALSIDREYSMANLLAEMVARGVPPGAWPLWPVAS